MEGDLFVVIGITFSAIGLGSGLFLKLEEIKIKHDSNQMSNDPSLIQVRDFARYVRTISYFTSVSMFISMIIVSLLSRIS